LHTHPPAIDKYSRQSQRGSVRRISLTHIKPLLTSYTPTWRWTGNTGRLWVHFQETCAICSKRKVMAMGTRRQWVGTLVIMVVLLVISTVPGHTDRGGHGYKGHGHRSHGHRSHWHGGHRHGGHWHRGWHRSGGVRLFISPGLVVPFGSYWEPYPDPPVVIAPSPRVHVPPAPPPPVYWYYCDAAQAYYLYVQQCPGGWRQVLPTPPS
jgi:hypothetical protein